jgi:putative addiction module component (TIGR02574 family)
MSEAAESLANTLLSLPSEDRLALANLLFDSLPPPPGLMSEDTPGFDDELERRLQDHLSGKSPGIPAEEFFKQLRANRS